jgi:hypothetical protein
LLTARILKGKLAAASGHWSSGGINAVVPR